MLTNLSLLFPPSFPQVCLPDGLLYVNGLRMRMSHFRFVWVLVVVALGTAFWEGSTTEPVTGRRQFTGLVSQSEEMQLGFNSFEQMKKEVPISRDPAANALLQKVGQRIAAVAEMPNAQWEFVVFDSKEANAFCLPGGKVGIYTGILPITQDEAGLATVIGHEVAHAAAHHGAERLSEAMLLQTGGQVLGAGLSSSSTNMQAAAATVYGLGTQLGLALPHSRTQESSADHIGLIYMARAGYPPEASVKFWERFAAYNKAQGGGGVWFLRTHPLDDTRIQQLKEWLPEAQKQYKAQR